MHLAQLNLAYAIASIDDPLMADFVNNVDRINSLSDNSPGFVWRMKVDDSGESEGEKVFGSPLFLVNMSVWKNRDSLFHFVYKSGHVDIFRRKKEWFKKIDNFGDIINLIMIFLLPKNHCPIVELPD